MCNISTRAFLETAAYHDQHVGFLFGFMPSSTTTRTICSRYPHLTMWAINIPRSSTAPLGFVVGYLVWRYELQINNRLCRYKISIQKRPRAGNFCTPIPPTTRSRPRAHICCRKCFGIMFKTTRPLWAETRAWSKRALTTLSNFRFTGFVPFGFI